MLETALNIFLNFFGVFAALTGSLGVVIVLWLWCAAEFLGKPVKVNGVDGPLDWPKRMLLALFAVPFACVAALGLWLADVDWLPAYLSSGIAALPWWAFGAYLFLCWLAATLFLYKASGWRKLSKVYPRPRGEALASEKLSWAIIGNVTYKNVLTISAYNDGLGVSQNRFFGPFDRSVLVPWNCVSVEAVKEAQPEQAKLSFDQAEQAPLTLLEECWQTIEQFKPGD